MGSEMCIRDRQSGTDCRIYIHISLLPNTAVSPFLYCFTMSMWVGGSLLTCSFLFFGLGAAAFRVDRARRGNVCLQDQAKACSPTGQPVRKFKDGLGINMTMKKPSLLYISHHVRSMASCEKHGVASTPRGARSGGHDSCQAARAAATCT